MVIEFTPAEKRVIECISCCFVATEAGEKLYITEKTVKFHLTNIYKKLNIAGCRALNSCSFLVRLAAKKDMDNLTETDVEAFKNECLSMSKQNDGDAMLPY